jgi:hypothetical protein
MKAEMFDNSPVETSRLSCSPPPLEPDELTAVEGGLKPNNEEFLHKSLIYVHCMPD